MTLLSAEINLFTNYELNHWTWSELNNDIIVWWFFLYIIDEFYNTDTVIELNQHRTELSWIMTLLSAEINFVHNWWTCNIDNCNWTELNKHQTELSWIMICRRAGYTVAEFNLFSDSICFQIQLCNIERIELTLNWLELTLNWID